MEYTITITHWHPARLNQWDGRHWSVRAGLKKADRVLVAWYAKACRVPEAICKRRVSLILTLASRQRSPDPDAFWKSSLDALTAAGLLVNDSGLWCELGTVKFRRGQDRQTELVLEDLDPNRKYRTFSTSFEYRLGVDYVMEPVS